MLAGLLVRLLPPPVIFFSLYTTFYAAAPPPRPLARVMFRLSLVVFLGAMTETINFRIQLVEHVSLMIQITCFTHTHTHAHYTLRSTLATMPLMPGL